MQQRGANTINMDHETDEDSIPQTARGRNNSKLTKLVRSHAMREEASPPRDLTPRVATSSSTSSSPTLSTGNNNGTTAPGTNSVTTTGTSLTPPLLTSAAAAMTAAVLADAGSNGGGSQVAVGHPLVVLSPSTSPHTDTDPTPVTLSPLHPHHCYHHHHHQQPQPPPLPPPQQLCHHYHPHHGRPVSSNSGSASTSPTATLAPSSPQHRCCSPQGQGQGQLMLSPAYGQCEYGGDGDNHKVNKMNRQNLDCSKRHNVILEESSHAQKAKCDCTTFHLSPERNHNNNLSCNANNNISNTNNSNTLTVSRAANARPKLRQQSSSYSSFEGSSSASPCLSRDNSSEQYTDTTGVDLDTFIPETLNRNAKDRSLMLHIEEELISLAKDQSRTHYKFPPMSSYQRMLVHRCAAYFGMDHNIEISGKCVVVNRTKSTRIPTVAFKEHIKIGHPFTDEPRRSILKRDLHNSSGGGSMEEYGGGGGGKSPDGGMDRRSKSFEEREEEYAKVRRRIFNPMDMHDRGSTDDFRWSDVRWPSTDSDGSTRNKLHPMEHYHRCRPGGRLQKVQSEEKGDDTLRPCVAKSYSFGGYGGCFSRGDSIISTHSASPRLLTKQDSTASSMLRLSPSSSGYKTQSQRSESVTPSPTSTPYLSETSTRQDSTNSTATNVSEIPNESSEQPQLVWAVTDIHSVPKGSVIINPQTGQPVKNQDGSIYHYDPCNPPPGYASCNVDGGNGGVQEEVVLEEHSPKRSPHHLQQVQVEQHTQYVHQEQQHFPQDQEEVHSPCRSVRERAQSPRRRRTSPLKKQESFGHASMDKPTTTTATTTTTNSSTSPSLPYTPPPPQPPPQLPPPTLTQPPRPPSRSQTPIVQMHQSNQHQPHNPQQQQQQQQQQRQHNNSYPFLPMAPSQPHHEGGPGAAPAPAAVHPYPTPTVFGPPQPGGMDTSGCGMAMGMGMGMGVYPQPQPQPQPQTTCLVYGYGVPTMGYNGQMDNSIQEVPGYYITEAPNSGPGAITYQTLSPAWNQPSAISYYANQAAQNMPQQRFSLPIHTQGPYLPYNHSYILSPPTAHITPTSNLPPNPDLMPMFSSAAQPTLIYPQQQQQPPAHHQPPLMQHPPSIYPPPPPTSLYNNNPLPQQQQQPYTPPPMQQQQQLQQQQQQQQTQYYSSATSTPTGHSGGYSYAALPPTPPTPGGYGGGGLMGATPGACGFMGNCVMTPTREQQERFGQMVHGMSQMGMNKGRVLDRRNSFHRPPTTTTTTTHKQHTSPHPAATGTGTSISRSTNCAGGPAAPGQSSSQSSTEPSSPAATIVPAAGYGSSNSGGAVSPYHGGAPSGYRVGGCETPPVMGGGGAQGLMGPGPMGPMGMGVAPPFGPNMIIRPMNTVHSSPPLTNRNSRSPTPASDISLVERQKYPMPAAVYQGVPYMVQTDMRFGMRGQCSSFRQPSIRPQNMINQGSDRNMRNRKPRGNKQYLPPNGRQNI